MSEAQEPMAWNLWQRKYPCGTEASGGPSPLPTECPKHGATCLAPDAPAGDALARTRRHVEAGIGEAMPDMHARLDAYERAARAEGAAEALRRAADKWAAMRDSGIGDEYDAAYADVEAWLRARSPSSGTEGAR